MARPTVAKNQGNHFSQYSDVTNGQLVSSSAYCPWNMTLKYKMKLSEGAWDKILHSKFSRQLTAVYEQSPLTGLLNISCEHLSSPQLSFLRNFHILDTKTSIPHITRPWIWAHYTEWQLFFQSDLRIPFSSMVQHVRRSFFFCHKTPIVSIASNVLVVFVFFRWE